ncbi:2670_t:CDS:2 [Racocetra fulgida]|uniref:2670_t:CDS:1 n=1 Tax=Racocetra fulgida TaxID=60492 RepID=A0A9N8VAV1_9GLOM|nr:2670_t:CDS:2 [Racocetra fulgida]
MDATKSSDPDASEDDDQEEECIDEIDEFFMDKGNNDKIRNEIKESFENDVKLVKSDIPDVAIYFFNEEERVTKNEDENIIDAINKLTPEIIESNQEKGDQNLKGLELPVSESDFDHVSSYDIKKFTLFELCSCKEHNLFPQVVMEKNGNQTIAI